MLHKNVPRSDSSIYIYVGICNVWMLALAVEYFYYSIDKSSATVECFYRPMRYFIIYFRI